MAKAMRTEFFRYHPMAEDKDDILEQVRAFAESAHGSQMRKFAQEPYIAHLVRVMETVREYTHDVALLSAALLHDVLEDTRVTEDELGIFLNDIMDEPVAARTLDLVVELTDVYIKADYPTLNRRTRRTKEAGRLSHVSPEAQTVKYADVIDNAMDIVRHETDFALVYLRESKQLLKGMTRGNPLLHERAVRTVDECLREFWNKQNIRAL
jgi:guanosine-3',5'-bis(diphosphate) 3'-pyrophosphohydrolase